MALHRAPGLSLATCPGHAYGVQFPPLRHPPSIIQHWRQVPPHTSGRVRTRFGCQPKVPVVSFGVRGLGQPKEMLLAQYSLVLDARRQSLVEIDSARPSAIYICKGH